LRAGIELDFVERRGPDQSVRDEARRIDVSAAARQRLRERRAANRLVRCRQPVFRRQAPDDGLEHGALRADQPTHGGIGDRVRHTALAHLRANGGRAVQRARVQQAGYLEQAVGRQGAEMPHVQPEIRLQAQAAPAQPRVGADHIADLLPRLLHELLLKLADDLRAQSSGHAAARVQVELAQPGRIGGRDRVLPGVPLPVERRSEDRRRILRPLLKEPRRQIERRCQSLLDFVRNIAQGAGGARGRAQSPVHQRVGGVLLRRDFRQQRVPIADVHRDHAHRIRTGERLELARQRLEIAQRPGGEFPVKIDRELHFPRRRSPGGRQRLQGVGRAAQPAQHARAKGGHHTGNILAVRQHAARADQARDIQIRLPGQF